MGLFWGSKKEEPAPQPPTQKTPEMELFEKLTQPLEIGYVTGCGPANASQEFGYIIRRMDDSVYKNNCHIREIKELVKQLIAENQEIRKRLEKIEEQHIGIAKER